MANIPGEGNVENPKVSIPATITKITTMADRSLRLQVDTQELDPDMKGDVFEMYDKVGYFFFSEAPIRQIDFEKVPEIKLDEDEKSPSQRLRAVLYVFWEQQKSKESFEVFYRKAIERYIQAIKERLA